MKKTVLFIAAVFTLATSAFAHPVTATMASHVAATFWAGHRPANLKATVTPKALSFPELDQLHIFDMEGMGFVIVPADDRVMPVLAYSFEDPFPSSLNPEIAYWLHGYNDQIAEAVKSDYPQRESLLQEWGQLFLSGVLTDDYGLDSNRTTDITDIPAMLETRWDQGDPFNTYCPYDSIYGGRTVVGCVATAMAQIMKYWNYPSFGQDTHSYIPRTNSNLPRQSVDFGRTTYLWQFMPKRLSSATSVDYQVDAVATLSYHCGVAVDMMYGTSAVGGSGAYSDCGYWATACATDGFVRYFKYDSTLYFANRSRFTDSAWTATINHNLALGQPMYYDGSDSTGGHAFVLDGSDTEGRYHFNWGWGGFGNGFYTIDNLAPGAGGAGGNATYTFNSGQGAIFGIRPGMVEVFDTVDYYDSICTNSQYRYFREYKLRAVAMDTLLRHLDTIFNYHLRIIGQKQVFLNSNTPNDEPDVVRYCPATGFTFPECTFDNNGAMFIGWCSKANGDDTIYSPGHTVFINTNKAYFALWLGGVGIEEREDEALQARPTVTTDEVHFSLTGEYDVTITVIDTYGRVVKQQTVAGREARISLAGFPAGAYNIVITAPKTVYKTRIIKL